MPEARQEQSTSSTSSSSRRSATVHVPACYSGRLSFDRNPVRQLLVPEGPVSVVLESNGKVTVRGDLKGRFSIVRSAREAPTNRPALHVPRTHEVVDGDDLRGDTSRWVGHRDAVRTSDVLESWRHAFQYLEEDSSKGSAGLRSPQTGAVHAVLGYWTTDPSHPATVVMPTGTGKTEAMLALLAAARIKRLLVIVPSDALREQLAAKFESFGVLQASGVVASTAMRPVVGQLRHKFTSIDAALQHARACNVVVSTPAALYASSPAIRLALYGECSHLFVDEAHHVPAATWRQIRDEFEKKPIVQFTATPFREDGKALGGRLIYAFPLREAQRQGYFSKIDYISVVDFENQDRAITQAALDRLRKDLKGGLDHLLMARVKRIGRAGEILKLYQDLAGDLEPVILHSGETATNRKDALEAIRSRKSRVIVCVDMLGEGFDLPSLKVAAIHDPHKSLGVTLQFVGRFARATGSSLGDATVVVGRPDLDYDDKLRQLYSEDADWNRIIRDLSEGAVEQQEEISEFEQGFASLPEEVALRNLLPKMSTVVYRTKTNDWDPQAILEVFPEEELLTVPIGLNAKDRVAWFVTEEHNPVRWGDLQTIDEVTYHLYVLHWNQQRQLLFINSSNNGSLHEGLAKVVCGEEAKRITGENVYRVMAQVQRLVPTNVGVLDIRNRARRFSMHVGADVTEGFPVTEAQTKTKTNIFAYGFEDGERISVGASLKGRVWSFRVANTLKDWVDWCNHVGAKLIDDTISVDEVMRNFIRPKVVEERPALVPLALEWPWEVFRSTTEEVRVQKGGGSSWPLIDADLTVSDHSTEGPIPFRIATPEWSAEYEAALGGGAIEFSTKTKEVEVVTRWTRVPLSQYLSKRGLTFHFEQDAVVVAPGILLQPDRDIPPFDTGNMRVLDWSGINLRKESQGPNKEADSIQARAIQDVLSLADWDFVIDDDGTGEIADIVAMRADDEALHIRFVHCKFSSEDKPGARVEDLYELCGQAQKSAQWRRNVPLLFQHLIRREKTRKTRHGRSGFEKGQPAKLYELEERARLLRHNLTVAIVQPGVSREKVSKSQLELLASTEVYVYETVHAGFEVICSK